MLTNDTVLLLANGAAGNAQIRSARGPDAARVRRGARGGLRRPGARDRARRRGRDEARDGATSAARARRSRPSAPRSRIANSMLVKTALFGGDPNWGRVLRPSAPAGSTLDLAKAGCGGPASPSSRRRAPPTSAAKRAGAAMGKPDIDVVVDLARGRVRGDRLDLRPLLRLREDQRRVHDVIEGGTSRAAAR